MLKDVTNTVHGLVVIMDGGIRRGSNVPKALGFGSRCVFAGRLFNFALAAGGADGVKTASCGVSAWVERGG